MISKKYTRVREKFRTRPDSYDCKKIDFRAVLAYTLGIMDIPQVTAQNTKAEILSAFNKLKVLAEQQQEKKRLLFALRY